MSTVGYIITLDNQPPGAEPPVAGKAYAAAWLVLDELCASSGVPDIDVFTGQRMSDTVHAIVKENLPDLARNLGQEMDLPSNEVKWFRPEDGIIVVDALAALVQKNSAAFESAEAVVQDLKNFRLVLGMAKKEGAKWHLVAIDTDSDQVEAGFALRRGEYDKAMPLYNRLLAQGAQEGYNRACVLTERGDCWSGLGDQDRAIADYDAALNEQPDYHYALLNRGSVWLAKQEYDRALADYNAAFELKPEGYVPTILHERALVRVSKQDYDRALADFDAAIRLEPEYGSAYGSRGRTYFFKGDFRKAAADLARAEQLDADAYQPLWLYLARVRSGARDAKSDLAAQAKALGTSDWPLSIFALFLGKAKPESVIAEAGRADAEELEVRRCEARFFVGQWYLLNKDVERACALFREVRLTETTLQEYAGARAELQRL